MDATTLAKEAIFRLTLELEAERIEKRQLQDQLEEVLSRLEGEE